MSEPVAPRRIAIVGGGPRGLYALDCLCGWARLAPHLSLAITLYEPAARPGAGPVYDPAQPDYLLMNFAAGLIDAWDRTFAANASRPTLVDWLSVDRGETVDAGAYVPRAAVGRYLMACYQQLVHACPNNVALVHRQAFVSEVIRVGAAWQVSDGTCADRFDEVLLTTGHQRWQSADGAKPISAFPAARLARSTAFSAGPLYCKGFGLTFIDAALALTQGRGGAFVRQCDGALSYQSAGAEPACIRPLSRTGRPMLAKPDAGVIAATPAREALIAELSQWLDQQKRPVTDVEAELWPAFLRAADAYIEAPAGQTQAWFNRWCHCQPSAASVRRMLAESWAMATGGQPAGPGVALALVWRGTYPALVRLASHDGLAPAALPQFRRIATEMERIAFGPAAANIERLLALIDAGVVDLSALGDAGAERVAADDYDIDATIAPPYRWDPQGPLDRLAADEDLSRTAYGTLAVTETGRPLMADTGRPVAGLAIIGRVTELSVIGNDTLSRRLHDTMRDWAAEVISFTHDVSA
ncbi:FAD/NAD(P)-binding protein [uncultured Salinisphaera sp.]|uniref:FAD/NAD(P)-binding protein n=1 Tax=uncultured Salinisphaera sp. TaxID=359372 RepID=UPI0032B28297|tara:strand:- start:4706 stop:6286 length:1581 start_codon:yes stop_codon:yes gene_type:complete